MQTEVCGAVGLVSPNRERFVQNTERRPGFHPLYRNETLSGTANNTVTGEGNTLCTLPNHALDLQPFAATTTLSLACRSTLLGLNLDPVRCRDNVTGFNLLPLQGRLQQNEGRASLNNIVYG